MPRTKAFAITGTAELNAMIERVASDILALLTDGAPRSAAACRRRWPAVTTARTCCSP